MKRTPRFLIKNIDKFLLRTTRGIIKNITTLFFWSLIFLSLPFIFYFINFHSGFSSNSADWGAFGSFIGGLLGPIVTFLTMIVLIANLYEARKTTKINKEIVETAKETAIIAKETAEITKKKFIQDDINEKIKTAISLTNELSNNIKKITFTYEKDIEKLGLEKEYAFIDKKKIYNFDEICDLWKHYIMDWIKINEDSGETIDTEEIFEKIIEEAFNYFYMLISINDELKIFPEIISIIKDIEDQEPTIASTPKKLFLASINETSRFWLYHLLIKNNNVISFDYKNNELHEYIILEWDDFLHTPEELSIY